MAVVWLAAPYLSLLAICRSPRLARRVAGHTVLTLPVGWAAVLGLFAMVVELWAPPLPLTLALAVLSGLAMVTSGPPDDDGPDEDEDETPSPPVDWDAFDAARSGWDRRRRPRPSPRTPACVR